MVTLVESILCISGRQIWLVMKICEERNQEATGSKNKDGVKVCHGKSGFAREVGEQGSSGKWKVVGSRPSLSKHWKTL